MRVVMITPYKIKDGLATYTSYLTKEMERITDLEIYPWNYSGIKKFFSPLLELRKLHKLLNSLDVFHVQYALGAYYPLFLPILCVLKKKAKVVLTLHEEYDNFALSRLVRLWHYFFYSCADILIVHALISKKKLPRRLSEKTVVIPHGIIYRERIKRKPVKGLVLLLGFINRWKGHDLAVKALPQVISEVPNAKLLIVGKAHDKSFFKEVLSLIRELKLEKRVIVREGYAPTLEFYSLLKKAEIGIIPYRKITMSGIVCHMISWKIPTILSNLQVFREFTKNKSLYFKNGDGKDLAKKIVLLLKDKKLQRRLSEHFSILAREHSWYNIAIKTKEAYGK